MFDEPLSNLDAALRARTRQEIASLHRRLGTAMIFVTHDQTEAMTLADRIVVMNRQRIEQIGSPLEIYRHPATLFVATFVGSPTMNILPATRLASDAQRVVLSDGTEIRADVPAALPAGDLRVGVRPESLQVCPPGGGDTRAFVEFVEFLGDRTHVHLKLASGDRLVALDEATFAGREGEALGVRFDRAALHLFDADGCNCRPAEARAMSAARKVLP